MKKNIKLIFELSRNDFVMKYASNHMGVLWAFVQPMITVLIYVFIFQYAFRVQPSSNGYPYALWVISGIIPWLFFSETWLSGGNAFVEYSYLVKKVVFDIEMLPMVKILSGFVIHVFFLAFTIVLFTILGFKPNVKMLQLPYYTVCLLALVAGIAYFTASVIPFFRDFYQIVIVITQIGMWMTPILWNYNDMLQNMGAFGFIFKLNPMFYIVKGYRDSFMDGDWFFGSKLTIYFWAVCLFFSILARVTMRKMRAHFADVL